MTDNQTEKQKVQEITDKDVELTMMDAQKGIDALQDSEKSINHRNSKKLLMHERLHSYSMEVWINMAFTS